jgi:hypothetical protein
MTSISAGDPTPQHERDVEDKALDDRSFRLNPEILQDMEGLDQMEVFLVRRTSLRSRFMEGIVIHLVGASLVAGVAFTVGVLLR